MNRYPVPPGHGRGARKENRVHAGRRALLLAAHYELQIVKCQAPGVPS